MAKITSLFDLDEIVITHQNHKEHDAELRAAQEFLSNRYPLDKVLSYKDAKGMLEDTANKDYRWVAAKHKGKILALVVTDIWDVPKSASKKELVSDGKHYYIPLFYATSAGKKYEPVLKALIKSHVIFSAQMDTSLEGRKNVGILTDDTRHKDVLRALAKQYGGGSLGEIGVPTLKETKNYEDVFKTNNYSEIVAIPFCKWTKSLAKRVVASYLDQSYNSKIAGEEGYRPLTNAEYFKDFVKKLDKRFPDGIVHFNPIR